MGRAARAPGPGRSAIPASAMEPPAPSLTEEDLTEVKKDVSSTISPWRPAGWGRAACRSAGAESGNPESESGVGGGACGWEGRAGPPGAFMEVTPGHL